MSAADPIAVAQAGDRARTAHEQEQADLREILDTAAGRRFIWSRLERCRLYESSWDPTVRIHFLEGIRHVGLQLLADVAAADESGLLRMMTEAHNRKIQDKRAMDAYTASMESE